MEDRIHSMCCLQMRIGRMRHRIVDKRIRDLGIHPGQHFVLANLSRAGRLPSQAQLAEEMNVSPALVARTLKNLESGGYIERADSRSDARRNEICITDRGEEALQEGMEIFRMVDARSFEGFSGEEMELFHSLLEKMLDNLAGLEQEEKEMKED